MSPRSDSAGTPALSPSSSLTTSTFRRFGGSTSSFFSPPALKTPDAFDELGTPLPVGRKLQGLFGVGDDGETLEGVDYFSLHFDSRTPIPPRASSLYVGRRASRSYDMLQLHLPDRPQRRPSQQHLRRRTADDVRTMRSIDAQSVASLPHQHLYLSNPDEVYCRCVRNDAVDALTASAAARS